MGLYAYYCDYTNRTARILPRFTSVNITKVIFSVVVSIMAIAMMVGILSSGFISDKLGLKLCLIIGCVVQTLGWAMLYFAPDLLVLMSGRIITGIGSGICTPASYIILSEYALIRYRGVYDLLKLLIISIEF